MKREPIYHIGSGGLPRNKLGWHTFFFGGGGVIHFMSSQHPLNINNKSYKLRMPSLYNQTTKATNLEYQAFIIKLQKLQT